MRLLYSFDCFLNQRWRIDRAHFTRFGFTMGQKGSELPNMLILTVEQEILSSQVLHNLTFYLKKTYSALFWHPKPIRKTQMRRCLQQTANHFVVLQMHRTGRDRDGERESKHGLLTAGRGLYKACSQLQESISRDLYTFSPHGRKPEKLFFNYITNMTKKPSIKRACLTLHALWRRTNECQGTNPSVDPNTLSFWLVSHTGTAPPGLRGYSGPPLTAFPY